MALNSLIDLSAQFGREYYWDLKLEHYPLKKSITSEGHAQRHVLSNVHV